MDSIQQGGRSIQANWRKTLYVAQITENSPLFLYPIECVILRVLTATAVQKHEEVDGNEVAKE